MVKSASKQESEASGIPSGILVYGGSFNPLHIGHMRLAIEAREKLSGLIDEVVFLPVSVPPHKNPRCLLPFEIRAQMIDDTLRDFPSMRCDKLEHERAGTSYTIDTLKFYRRRYLETSLYFLIGSADFELLPTWRDGLRLIELANFIVAPRGDFTWEDMTSLCKKFWGAASGVARGCDWLDSGFGTRVYWLPAHYLDISSSLVRSMWLANESITYLVPEPVRRLLDKQGEFVRKYWAEETC